MAETVKLKTSEWKVHTEERSRGRMKLTFKLSKDEAESFKNWSEVVKPEGIDENQFLKTIFFNGIEALNKQLSEIAEKEKDKIIAAQALQAQKDAANETQPQP